MCTLPRQILLYLMHGWYMYESSIKPRRFFSVRKIKMYNEQHAKPAVDDVRNSRSVKSHSLMRTTMIAR